MRNTITTTISQSLSYYPFGMLMPARSFTVGSNENYRFGFNTQEQDDEVYGNGNLNTAEFWEYNTRLGRRWNIDPVKKDDQTAYNVFANNPIWFVDLYGADSSLFDMTTGRPVASGVTPEEDKTSVWAVNTKSANYDPNNPWENAYQVFYSTGADKPVSGDLLRPEHPLYQKGWSAGDPVYIEDLLDMTGEFNSVASENIEFFVSENERYEKWEDAAYENFKECMFCSPTRQIIAIEQDKMYNWIQLVRPGGPYDLKSSTRNTYPNINSFGAAYIGEFSLYNGGLMFYDNYGNIAFGIWGRAYGYDLGFLKKGAGVAQLWDTGDWDPITDSKMISWGFKKYSFFYGL